MLDSFDYEKDFGILWFISGSEGLRGKLRTIPEDFIVEEQGEPRPGQGCSALKLRHRNWESHSLRMKIQRELGLREHDISVAGTKDKRAVVTQWMTFNKSNPPVLDIPYVEVLESRTCSSMLRSGEHEGNRFQIRSRETTLDGDDCLERARQIVGEVSQEAGGSLGAWPNFFGIQRFGAYRPVTHKVGRALVKEGPEAAVRLYVGTPGITEGKEREARELAESGAPWADILEATPEAMGFERMMIRHLCEKEDDFAGALLRLPRGLLMLFVHSYQSYLFNLALSRRLEKGFGSSTPLEGDLIQPPMARLRGGKARYVPVKKAGLKAATNAVAKGKGVLTAFLPGTDTPEAGGEQGEIEAKILEEERVSPRDFQIPSLPEASSKGVRRPISMFPEGLELRWDDGLVASFTLQSGSYATTILREIMKSPDPLVY